MVAGKEWVPQAAVLSTERINSRLVDSEVIQLGIMRISTGKFGLRNAMDSRLSDDGETASYQLARWVSTDKR